MSNYTFDVFLCDAVMKILLSISLLVFTETTSKLTDVLAKYDYMISIIKNGLDSLARQATIEVELKSLRLSRFMEKRDMKNQTAEIEKILEGIKFLLPQAPPSFRDEIQNIRCLRRNLLGIPWAQTEISPLSLINFSLKRFVVPLREGLQLAEETGQVKAFDKNF